MIRFYIATGKTGSSHASYSNFASQGSSDWRSGERSVVSSRESQHPRPSTTGNWRANTQPVTERDPASFVKKDSAAADKEDSVSSKDVPKKPKANPFGAAKPKQIQDPVLTLSEKTVSKEFEPAPIVKTEATLAAHVKEEYAPKKPKANPFGAAKPKALQDPVLALSEKTEKLALEESKQQPLPSQKNSEPLEDH